MFILPIQHPMYGILPYIGTSFMVNVGKDYGMFKSHISHQGPRLHEIHVLQVLLPEGIKPVNMPSALRMPNKKHVVYHPRRLSCLVVWFTFGSRDGEGEKNDSENLEFLSCGVFR